LYASASHDQERAGRSRLAQEILPHVAHRIVRGEDRQCDDVIEPAVRRGQRPAQVGEDLADLGVDVADADQHAVAVLRNLARDDQQVSRPDDVGEAGTVEQRRVGIGCRGMLGFKQSSQHRR
jgi:hypothetical protein